MGRAEDAEKLLVELLDRATADPVVGQKKYDPVVELMFRSYENDVRDQARRQGVPEARLQDVCDATWDAIPKALAAFKRDASFHTWLLRIATNKSIDEMRRARDKDHEALSSIVSKLRADSAERPSRQLAQAEFDRLARAAVEQLSADDRAILLLHYEDRLEPAAIAQRLGLLPNTAAKRLVRARQRVLKALKAAEEG